MSQFAFLKAEFPSVFEHAGKAESLTLSDPRGACFYARLALETAVVWMYEHDGTLRLPYDKALSSLIHEPTFRTLVGGALVTKARLIKDFGNRAVHDTRPISENTAIVALRELFHFAYWLVRTYAKGDKPAAGVTFSSEALPTLTQVEISTLTRLQRLADDHARQLQAREAAEAARIQTQQDREQLEAQITALRAEIAQTKHANQAIPDTHDYNEAQTRDAFIDLLLREAGWPLDQERDREFPVTGMPNNSGEGFVDYVHWGDDAKPLALTEAKRTRRDPREGQQQGKLYADCLETRYQRRPVIFYSNGYEHWLWDDADAPPRRVQGFYKKAELEWLHQRRSSRQSLSRLEIDTAIVERFYQTRAIRRLCDAFELEHLRKVLLVMATGTGKTRTVIAAIDLLMRAGWVKRVLFLADRVALVNQAVGAFKRHLSHVSPVNLVLEKDSEGRVYVATYPTMMNLIDEMRNGVRRFGVGHFDLIVIDEAHRSVYRKYQAIFDYFDSLLIGLTATPRSEIDRDTYRLFDLEPGVPTDAYDLEQAVADGYLVPPKAISVPLKFQREGIRYDDLSEEEQAQWDALEWSEDGEIPDRIEATSLNQWLFNADTVDKVLEHLMTHGLKVDDGDRLGKTILFAKNHAHAVFIEARFNAHYPHLKGEFARVIDNRTEYAQSLIDAFSDPNKLPQIAISVDMLDTGIDIPEVVNLVFFKIVRSKTKFWQMLGRGTRLCPNLFGPGQDKEHFLVFDFCQNFEFFNQNPAPDNGVVSGSLSEKLFSTRVELIGEIDAQPTPSEVQVTLRRSVAERLHQDVLGMNLDNFLVRPQRRLVEQYQEAGAWERLDRDARHALCEQLAPLPTAIQEDDLPAKQFDYLILLTQLAVLRADPAFKRYQERLIGLASQLEDLSNVPMVAAKLPLISAVQTDDYWQDIDLGTLEHLRHQLRSLIKLIEPTIRKPVYSDFEDEIGTAEEVTLADVGSGADLGRFRRKVRQFLSTHMDHITIQKVRRNEPLTALDLGELERIFVEEGVADPEDLATIRTEPGLGRFIRSLVGLDREAAKQALSSFTQGRPLSANQIEFVDLIIDYLTENGFMDPALLYQSPFTDFDDQGAAGVFSLEDAKVLVQLLKDVEQRVAA